MDDKPLIKVVVVGDGAVGKTCLLISFTDAKFPETYVPTVFNNSTKEIELKHDPADTDKINVTLDLWDTAGQEEFDRIRYLSYRDTQVFFFCFNVVDPVSFENIKSKWLPEVVYHMGNHKPVKMLVGLKSDLRTDEETIKKLKSEGKEPVSRSTIQAFAQEKGMSYMEVSALKNTNVREVFELAVRNFLGERKQKSEEDDGGCCLLL